eukprot:symbB.v1.2.017291.t1/scaffold1325.1/size176917/17
MALAVAASCGDYTTLPDPTFLDLSPMALNIDTLVSRDLEILAPVVERFADLVEIPLPHMENILKDHKNKALDNSESSWRNVTCEWLRANRALWESWIPDESKCFPGFGLYDSVLKEYTNDRNSTNAIVCQACRPGTNFQGLHWLANHAKQENTKMNLAKWNASGVMLACIRT